MHESYPGRIEDLLQQIVGELQELNGHAFDIQLETAHISDIASSVSSIEIRMPD